MALSSILQYFANISFRPGTTTTKCYFTFTVGRKLSGVLVKIRPLNYKFELNCVPQMYSVVYIATTFGPFLCRLAQLPQSGLMDNLIEGEGRGVARASIFINFLRFLRLSNTCFSTWGCKTLNNWLGTLHHSQT